MGRSGISPETSSPGGSFISGAVWGSVGWETLVTPGDFISGPSAEFTQNLR
jgi:hypothetical protein